MRYKHKQTEHSYSSVFLAFTVTDKEGKKQTCPNYYNKLHVRYICLLARKSFTKPRLSEISLKRRDRIECLQGFGLVVRVQYVMCVRCRQKARMYRGWEYFGYTVIERATD